MSRVVNKIRHPGRWTCDFNEKGEISSLHYSESFCRILGVPEKEIISTTEQGWLEGIHPDDKERVWSELMDVFIPHPEGLDLDTEYRFVTKDGCRWYRAYADITRNEKGFPVHADGVVIDINDQHENTDKLKEILKENKKQSKLIEETLDNLKNQYSILASMSGIYYSMHLIDLKNDTVTEFNAKDEVKQVVSRKHGVVQMMHQIMEMTTVDEYKTAALEFTDLSTLAKRMEGKKIITGEFVGKRLGWFEAQFIAIEVDKKNQPTKVVYTTQSIDMDKRREELLIQKSETDELTGFLNRRAYEDKIDAHNNIPVEEDFTYISFDVNELKVTNDTLGHRSGDELLIGACDCMKAAFGSYGALFRTGGDEFAAIIFIDEIKLKKVLNDFEEYIAKWSGKTVKKLSVSYGCVTKNEMPDVTVREMAVTADKRMYEAKSSYYQKSGTDRRGQKDSHVALCLLYTKILKINVTNDSYQIVNMDQEEQTEEKGFSDKISSWLAGFGKSGQVHPEDLKEYLEKTNLEYIRNYFNNQNNSKNLLRLFYKRRFGNNYKKVMMEIIPANDYTNENQSLYLYVKDID